MDEDFANKPNKVKWFRERVLGLHKHELVALVQKATNSDIDIKTIQTIERQNKASIKMKTKLWRGINLGIEGLRPARDPVTFEYLYSPPDATSGALGGEPSSTDKKNSSEPEKTSSAAATRKPAKKR